ncbi:hypothetical protein HanIR_Chr16g0830221 [Helianthus annuus]|nr:hypothetical protein HanIR_Chr16g0830221 [Helianthus annuus]
MTHRLINLIFTMDLRRTGHITSIVLKRNVGGICHQQHNHSSFQKLQYCH